MTDYRDAGPGAARQRRPRGEERARLRRQLAGGYLSGSSLRALAELHDLSYWLTRTLLLEAGVPMRPCAPRPRAGRS